ncbi:MAG: ThiF family adenylyltransferase [Verrucomicrobia bacterium]|nr:ThiF family adenylyltransferase [Verrucomicrobiota bacterium]MBU1910201.1 ThiF family adenylyltransferase [Verrucomicrobiota bacterium]
MIAEQPFLPLEPKYPDKGFSIKVVGLGGTGSQVARGACLFLGAAGTDSRIVLLDGDAFEPANAARMFFSRPGNKAAVLSEDLQPFLAGSRVTLLAAGEFITAENMPRWIVPGDVVFLCVDNHATRKLVSDFCAGRGGHSAPQDITLISGGNDGIETAADGEARRGTYGNVQVYLRRNGEDVTPDLCKFHPEIQTPRDHLPTDKGCSEMMDSVPQLVFANLLVASVMLNTFFLLVCGALAYHEIAFDLAEGLCRPVSTHKGPSEPYAL